jgi:multidrug transporter EmrE-like cation transporter
MPIRTLFLILLCVSLSAIAQITLKSGMSSARVMAAMAGGDGLTAAFTVATTPAVIIGLALYGFGAVAWLLVLNKVDVSMAYPFNGIGFIVTSLLAMAVLGEHFGFLRWIGTLLVAGGVYLVAIG